MPIVPMKEMVFDTHAHVLSADLARYPYSTLRGGAKPPVNPVVFTVEDMVRAMDEAGVAHACLVQRATLYGYDNRYTLDAAGHYPDLFTAIVVLDAQDPGAPYALRDLARRRRVAGLRIVAPGLSRDDTAWLDGDQAQELWRTAADLALPVTVILYRMNNEAGRAALLGIARRYPELPILIDHAGVPHASTPETRYAASQGIDYTISGPPDFGLTDAIAALAEQSHVHFKVTDINYDRLEDAHLDSAAFVRRLADLVGADRLLWGSDVGQSPAPYAEKIARLRRSAGLLSARERASFFGGTALRIYGSALERRS